MEAYTRKDIYTERTYSIIMGRHTHGGTWLHTERTYTQKDIHPEEYTHGANMHTEENIHMDGHTQGRIHTRGNIHMAGTYI